MIFIAVLKMIITFVMMKGYNDDDNDDPGVRHDGQERIGDTEGRGE